MIASLLAVLGVLTVRGRFDDPDLWWHLKYGQIIWTTHHIPTTDTLSWTTHHHATIPHEWLAQTLIYAAYRLAGYSGLMLWLCLASSALLIAGYALCSLYSGNAKVSFLGALAIWLFATSGLSIRPQLIGYILLILEMLLLHLGRARNPRWFLMLPPLFALWVNCHGSFFLGILLATVLLFTSYLNLRAGLLSASPWEPRRRRTLRMGPPALAGRALPQSRRRPPGRLPAPALLQSAGQRRQCAGVAAPRTHRPARAGTAGGRLRHCAPAHRPQVAAIRRRSCLLLALGTWLAMNHRRMVFVFGILAAPILCRLLADTWENYEAERDRPLPNLVLIVISLFVCCLAFPSRQSLAMQVAQQSPVKAVEFLQSHNLGSRMLNDYGYGGYLIWAAPQYPVFVDGRTDIFEWTGVLQDYGRWAMLQSPPHDLLDKYHIDFCLLEKNSPMAFVLPLMPDWKLVYSDDNSIIFQRTA